MTQKWLPGPSEPVPQLAWLVVLRKFLVFDFLVCFKEDLTTHTSGICHRGVSVSRNGTPVDAEGPRHTYLVGQPFLHIWT